MYFISHAPFCQQREGDCGQTGNAYWSRFLSEDRYLAEHPRAAVEIAQREVEEKVSRLRIGEWVRLIAGQQTLGLVIDEEAKKQVAQLDTLRTYLRKRLSLLIMVAKRHIAFDLTVISLNAILL